jgi:hypothetical protein
MVTFMQRPERHKPDEIRRTRTDPMPAPSRKSSSDESWVEYRLLILAELERLNECVDRLRDQDASAVSDMRAEIARTCRKVAAHLDLRVETSTTIHATATQALADRVSSLELAGHQDSHSSKRKDRWAFWTAVITIIGTLIASIISLVLSLRQTGP